MDLLHQKPVNKSQILLKIKVFFLLYKSPSSLPGNVHLFSSPYNEKHQSLSATTEEYLPNTSSVFFVPVRIRMSQGTYSLYQIPAQKSYFSLLNDEHPNFVSL
jgi:hypothetical protein